MLFLVTKLHLWNLNVIESTFFVNIKMKSTSDVFVNKKRSFRSFLIPDVIFYRKKRFRKFSVVLCATSDSAHDLSCAIYAATSTT